MKKILTISALSLLMLVGCQDSKNETLDTSQLNEIEINDVTEEQKKNIPITYEAPSVKDGLDALPFELKLPEKLPFDATFQPPTIGDMNHDGKKIAVEIKALPKNKDNKAILLIQVLNEEVKNGNPDWEQIKLKNNVVAGYSAPTLNFNKDGITYTITYLNEKVTEEQRKIEITEIANQMF